MGAVLGTINASSGPHLSSLKGGAKCVRVRSAAEMSIHSAATQIMAAGSVGSVGETHSGGSSPLPIILFVILGVLVAVAVCGAVFAMAMYRRRRCQHQHQQQGTITATVTVELDS